MQPRNSWILQFFHIWNQRPWMLTLCRPLAAVSCYHYYAILILQHICHFRNNFFYCIFYKLKTTHSCVFGQKWLNWNVKNIGLYMVCCMQVEQKRVNHYNAIFVTTTDNSCIWKSLHNDWLDGILDRNHARALKE